MQGIKLLPKADPAEITMEVTLGPHNETGQELCDPN